MDKTNNADDKLKEYRRLRAKVREGGIKSLTDEERKAFKRFTLT